jgi:hypothetical protein
MEYVHDCFFCGWRRQAPSATVLQPGCEQCGCALRSLPRPELDRIEPSEAPAPPRTDSRLTLAARVAAGLFLMIAAARTGYVEAGPAIALAAFGGAGLAAVPVLVPSR